MMKYGVLVLVTLMAAACMPIQAPAGGTVPAPSADAQPPASIAFADGSLCLWAGAGATLAFDGARVNYTCTIDGVDSGEVILGDIVAADADSTFVTLTRATVESGSNGFTLASAAEGEYMIAFVTLDDGSQCANAGQGATFGSPEVGRANYTCGATDVEPIGALFGPLQQGSRGEWTATYGLAVRGGDGFVIDEVAPRPLTELVLEQQ